MRSVFDSWLKLLVVSLFTAMMLTSCGTDPTFTINGEIENFGTGNLRVVYFANGAIQSAVAPAVDGKFSMQGSTGHPTLARIYTGNGMIIGRFPVRGGETIEAHISATDVAMVDFRGDDDAKALAAFLSDNADVVRKGDAGPLNSAIAAYVKANPEAIASGVLMSEYYITHDYETEAISLIDQLGDDARAASSLGTLAAMLRSVAPSKSAPQLDDFKLYGTADSLESVLGDSCRHTLLMINNAPSLNADSLRSVLSILRPLTEKKKLKIFDIGCDNDTMAWHNSLREVAHVDSLNEGKLATVKRVWSPSPFTLTAFTNMEIAQVPWFIVTDSTRRVIYHGSSLSAARRAVEK
jgi:hypothetical protein